MIFEVKLTIQNLLILSVVISANCVQDTVSKTDYGDSTKLIIKTTCSHEYYELTRDESKYMLSLEYFAPPFDSVKKATKYINKYTHVSSCGMDTIIVHKDDFPLLLGGCISGYVKSRDGLSRAKNGKMIMMMGDLMGVDLRKPVELDTPAQARKKGVDESVIAAYSETPMTAIKLVEVDGTEARQVFTRNEG